jgi:hypothetical protein
MQWMWDQYINGAEWVMMPNVMGLWADGGRMATKPAVSGGAYINRMSDYCSSCGFDPRNRTGDDACPFTTLHWDFLDTRRLWPAATTAVAQPGHNAPSGRPRLPCENERRWFPTPLLPAICSCCHRCTARNSTLAPGAEISGGFTSTMALDP